MGCDAGVLLWKLNVGLAGVEAVVVGAAGAEVVGAVEPRFPNMLPDPGGFVPNMPPEGAEEAVNGDALVAGVCAGSEGLEVPNTEPPPKRLLPAGLEALSVGGGPAGVVEFPKFKNGLLGAGVVDPAGAVVETFVDELNILCPPAALFRPPNMLGVVVPPVPLSLFAPGVDAPASSFFCPNVNAPVLKGVDCPAPPKIELDPLPVPTGLRAPPAGAVPVLLLKSDGVDVPEPGFDPVFPPPKIDGAGALPAPEVLLRLPKSPPLLGGCEVAGG